VVVAEEEPAVADLRGWGGPAADLPARTSSRRRRICVHRLSLSLISLLSHLALSFFSQVVASAGDDGAPPRPAGGGASEHCGGVLQAEAEDDLHEEVARE
jgi:hypothetical protein